MHLPPPHEQLAELQLRALNHRLLSDAHDAQIAPLQAVTAADFVHTAADGQWHGREAFIALRRSATAARAATLLAHEVRLFGSVALVQGLLAPADDTVARIRFTDVHVWQGQAWHLVATQDTALKAGVADAMNRASHPAPSRWQGEDPAGDDDVVLHTLNEHYVRAFREADVSWYDAHLSSDYRVISGDGSLNDRATALHNFAKPTFATAMRRFPVGNVRVRRFGEVALIHAENDYELNDGRRGISRYTDIWVQQGQAWRCVGAHITVHRAP